MKISDIMTTNPISYFQKDTPEGEREPAKQYPVDLNNKFRTDDVFLAAALEAEGHPILSFDYRSSKSFMVFALNTDLKLTMNSSITES